MTHLDIYNTSYGKKKGRESNWQFDSRSQKVGNQPNPCACKWRATTLLESSQQELQLCFRPYPDQRSERGIIAPQSCESSNLSSFGTLLWESRDKKPFGCEPHGEVQSILYGGRWWLPLSPGDGESYESKVAHGSS
jgi:hypothetical protein